MEAGGLKEARSDGPDETACAAPQRVPTLPPEVAFLAEAGIPLGDLCRAADQARDWGVDAAAALLATGRLAEDAYYRALARRLGVPFLAEPRLAARRLRYPDDLALGLAPLDPLPVAHPGAPARVVAPRGRSIAALLAGIRPAAEAHALTSPTRLRRAVFAACPDRVAALARDGLSARHPDWACRPGLDGPRLALAGLVVVLAVGLVAVAPGWAASLALTLLNLGVLASLTFRLGVAFVGPEPGPEPTALPDDDLPIYTVLVPLYREAAVVPRLVRALARLDYPPAKLDIKLIVEADDAETADALARIPFPARFEVVVAPEGAPRTKPRALNVALPLARGALLVVYDAEDVPEPGQLRAAAARLAALPQEVACLQGRLVIDNSADSWLTRCFTLEYAGLFDVIGPALTRWQLPFPLGGTTTHFRTRCLRALGGWDAWNVTEDADLGLRLAVAGYRVADLPRDTIEEAPAAFRPWLAQRTRWMKGFLQTTYTHGRSPRRALRRLGGVGLLCAVALVPGTVISALAYPFLLGLAAWRFVAGTPDDIDTLAALALGSGQAVLAAGLVALVLPPAIGCVRRRWWGLLPFLPLLPLLYAPAACLAAWASLGEIARAPTRWNKTAHGLARTSRTGVLTEEFSLLDPLDV